MRRTLFAALLVPAFAALPPRLPAAEVLLFDDFDGPALNASLWGLADWTIGDRTQFGKQPEFAAEVPDPLNPTTFIRLLLDTYSPVQPGQRLYGTEIYSLQNFTNTGGVEYLARARLATDAPGLVAAFFTYNQRRQKGRWLSDEIDFVVLSKQATDRVTGHQLGRLGRARQRLRGRRPPPRRPARGDRFRLAAVEHLRDALVSRPRGVVTNPRRIAELTGHKINQFAVSPDGRLVAVVFRSDHDQNISEHLYTVNLDTKETKAIVDQDGADILLGSASMVRTKSLSPGKYLVSWSACSLQFIGL